MASSNPSPFRLAQLSPLRAGRARWWIGAISAGVGLLVGTPMGVLGDELANEKIELFPEKLGPLPAQAPPAPLPSLSAQTCNACHGAIHDEWKASGHSRASTNLVYRKSVEALGNPTGQLLNRRGGNMAKWWWSEVVRRLLLRVTVIPPSISKCKQQISNGGSNT